MSAGSWAGVREQIQGLAKAPGASAVNGVKGHGFSLEDPLDERELPSWRNNWASGFRRTTGSS
jgi:hypothetical protein